MEPSEVNYPRRGEIYLVNFDPSEGAEIKKTRPAVILQNNIANEHSSVVIVTAVTSKFDKRLYPTEVLVKANEGGLEVDSVVLLNQIQSVDKRRLIKRLGTLHTDTMKKVDQALQISLGLVKL